MNNTFLFIALNLLRLENFYSKNWIFVWKTSMFDWFSFINKNLEKNQDMRMIIVLYPSQ